MKLQFKKFLEAFWSISKKSQIDFPLYFQKSDFFWGGDSFFTKFLSENTKHPKICPSFGGNVGETYLFFLRLSLDP